MHGQIGLLRALCSLPKPVNGYYEFAPKAGSERSERPGPRASQPPGLQAFAGLLIDVLHPTLDAGESDIGTAQHNDDIFPGPDRELVG